MPNSVVALFCEDIRIEQSGQHTLVGVLSDNMAVPSIPGAIPKLGIFVRAQIETRHLPQEIIIGFKNTDGTNIALPTWDRTTIEKGQSDSEFHKSPIYGLILTAIISPFHIPSYGKIVLSVTIERETYIAGILNIISATSTVSAQPALQSPTVS